MSKGGRADREPASLTTAFWGSGLVVVMGSWWGGAVFVYGCLNQLRHNAVYGCLSQEMSRNLKKNHYNDTFEGMNEKLCIE